MSISARDIGKSPKNMALFCVVEINHGIDEKEIFECPLSWFSKENGTVCYPTGTKFNSWKGRTDKPPFSKGGTWITVPATLKGEFCDYCSAVECAKRLEVMDTSEEEAFRTNSRSINALHEGLTGFSVEGILTDKNKVSDVELRPAKQTSSTSFNLCPMDPPMQSAVHQSSLQDDQLASVILDNEIPFTPASDSLNETQVQNIIAQALALDNETLYIPASDSLNETQVQNITAESLADQIAATVTKVLRTEFAKIHARLDKITEAIAVLGISQKVPLEGSKSGHQNPSYLLPIADERQIEKLDNLLRNSDGYEAFVEDMSRYAGKSGAMRGQKVALSIVDKWFKREFLVQCSWTGSMKSKTKHNTTNVVSVPHISNDTQDDTEEKNMKKINFSRYKRVFEAFYTVVHLADSRYSKQEADFLKKQLRNANSRLNQFKSSEGKKVVKEPELKT